MSNVFFTFADMPHFISPLFTFPPISWWAAIVDAERVIFDTKEPYQKMSYRNRYKISGANNPILLTVPLVKGRHQHTALEEVYIFNDDFWQVQHWRTLISVYRRSPYFEYYEDSLRELYENEYWLLSDFNYAAMRWVKHHLQLRFEELDTQDMYGSTTDTLNDLRTISFNKKNNSKNYPRYYQIFEDRIGFQADLSILDLMFSEGIHTIQRLSKNDGITT